MTKPRKKPIRVAQSAAAGSRLVSRAQRLADLAREPGSTAASVAAALTAEGYTTSRATAGRALAALRGPQRMGRVRTTSPRTSSAAASTSQAPTDEQVALSRDLTQLDGWLDIAGAMARDAQSRGDNALLAKAGSLAVMILEARRKAEPPVTETDGVWIPRSEAQLTETAVAHRLASVIRHVRERLASGESVGENASPIERELWKVLS